MKVLLDECCPGPIKRAVNGFPIFTVDDAGVKGLSNGTLLSEIEGKFENLVTADKNFRYQQRLSDRQVAIIELPTNSWPKLKSLIPALEAAIKGAKPGEYIVISRHPPVRQ